MEQTCSRVAAIQIKQWIVFQINFSSTHAVTQRCEVEEEK